MRNGERNGSAVKNQVRAPLLVRRLLSMTCVTYVDATPGAVEGTGAANGVSGEQTTRDRPGDVVSPPPGELSLGLGSLFSCMIERNLRLVIDSPLA